MPPPVPAESETESVASGQVTPRANPSDQAKDELADTIMKDSKAQNEDSNAQIENENEDKEPEAATDDEEYVPEKILTHRADFDLEPGVASSVRYKTKWVGYEKVADQTWEPEENFTNSRDLLEAYWERIGGRPVGTEAGPKSAKGKGKRLSTKRSKAKLEDSESPAPKRQKTGRKSIAQEEDDTPNTPEFRGYSDIGQDDWKPPAPKDGEWDKALQKVDTIEQDDAGERWVYLCWNDKNSDGRFYRSKAKLPTVYKAAPQEMLKFYEQHLIFTQSAAKYQKGHPQHVPNGENGETGEESEIQA